MLWDAEEVIYNPPWALEPAYTVAELSLSERKTEKNIQIHCAALYYTFAVTVAYVRSSFFKIKYTSTKQYFL